MKQVYYNENCDLLLVVEKLYVKELYGICKEDGAEFYGFDYMGHIIEPEETFMNQDGSVSRCHFFWEGTDLDERLEYICDL